MKPTLLIAVATSICAVDALGPFSSPLVQSSLLPLPTVAPSISTVVAQTNSNTGLLTKSDSPTTIPTTANISLSKATDTASATVPTSANTSSLPLLSLSTLPTITVASAASAPASSTASGVTGVPVTPTSEGGRGQGVGIWGVGVVVAMAAAMIM